MSSLQVHLETAGIITATAVSRSCGLSFQMDLNGPFYILLCCFTPRAWNQCHRENPPPTYLPHCLDNTQHHLLSLLNCVSVALSFCLSLFFSLSLMSFFAFLSHLSCLLFHSHSLSPHFFHPCWPCIVALVVISHLCVMFRPPLWIWDQAHGVWLHFRLHTGFASYLGSIGLASRFQRYGQMCTRVPILPEWGHWNLKSCTIYPVWPFFPHFAFPFLHWLWFDKSLQWPRNALSKNSGQTLPLVSWHDYLRCLYSRPNGKENPLWGGWEEALC